MGSGGKCGQSSQGCKIDKWPNCAAVCIGPIPSKLTALNSPRAVPSFHLHLHPARAAIYIVNPESRRRSDAHQAFTSQPSCSGRNPPTVTTLLRFASPRFLRPHASRFLHSTVPQHATTPSAPIWPFPPRHWSQSSSIVYRHCVKLRAGSTRGPRSSRDRTSSPPAVCALLSQTALTSAQSATVVAVCTTVCRVAG